jgi:hypothetical protein
MRSGLRKHWKILLSAFLVGLLILAYFGYQYSGHVSSAFGWISDETGGNTMAVLVIGLALVGVVYASFCLIFPMIVYFGLRDLRRRSAHLEKTLETFTTLFVREANNGVRPEAAVKSSEKEARKV